MAERLQKVLARSGVASRRKAEELIVARRVTVNDKVATLGMVVGRDDKIRVDGSLIKQPSPGLVFLLNKPVGYITTSRDEKGRKTVMELVPSLPGLHPVGRLDKDTEGLLLLTNDGEITNRLTHPRFGKEKEYRVWTEQGMIASEAIAKLKKGVWLEDGRAKAVHVKAAPGGCIVILQEGRKRQVRRMVEAVGYSVSKLRRTRIGGLKLGSLPIGHFRELNAKELASLTQE